MTDPEGMLEDEFLSLTTEEKETQSGYLLVHKEAQTEPRIAGKNATSQTGRMLRKVNAEDTHMVTDGQYLAIRAGRRAADTTQALGNVGRGEGERMKLTREVFVMPTILELKRRPCAIGWTKC